MLERGFYFESSYRNSRPVCFVLFEGGPPGRKTAFKKGTWRVTTFQRFLHLFYTLKDLQDKTPSSGFKQSIANKDRGGFDGLVLASKVGKLRGENGEPS